MNKFYFKKTPISKRCLDLDKRNTKDIRGLED